MLWTVRIHRGNLDPVVIAVDATRVAFSPHAEHLWIYGENGDPEGDGDRWEVAVIRDFDYAVAHPAPELPDKTAYAEHLLTEFGYKASSPMSPSSPEVYWPKADLLLGAGSYKPEPMTRKIYKPGEEIDPAVKPVAGTLLVDKDGGKWVAAGVYARRHEGREWVLLRHLCRDLGPVIASEDDPTPEDDGGVDTRTVLYPAGLEAAMVGTLHRSFGPIVVHGEVPF